MSEIMSTQKLFTRTILQKIKIPLLITHDFRCWKICNTNGHSVLLQMAVACFCTQYLSKQCLSTQYMKIEKSSR